jgi:hypothetical protein
VVGERRAHADRGARTPNAAAVAAAQDAFVKASEHSCPVGFLRRGVRVQTQTVDDAGAERGEDDDRLMLDSIFPVRLLSPDILTTTKHH